MARYEDRQRHQRASESRKRRLTEEDVKSPSFGHKKFQTTATAANLCSDSLAGLDWASRAKALDLLALSSPADQEGYARLETTLCKFCRDHDARVRDSAVHNLWTVADRAHQVQGFALGPETYRNVCLLLDDSSESVRLRALEIIKLFSDAQPEKKISLSRGGAQLRLADDAFTKLCNAMHDLSLRVRTQAARLLGQMENVSDSFLEQTLDKKLMSRMRFVTSGKRISKRDRLFQEWSTGKKLGEDIPAERLDEDSVSLIPSGACGAFVTGLEDEFMDVRLVSVRSLSNLAQNRPAFAYKAMDFLADMFNDEIEQVRLDSINCLLPLVRHAQLQQEQMEIILNVLDDAMADSRTALRELLCCCRLATKPCLKMAVAALLNNLKRYPADRESIWNCMKHLGANHASLVQPLVNDLLGFHSFLDVPEPGIEDPNYVAKLILVLNAAAKLSPIRSLFAPHTWRHYLYLKSSCPQFVPSLEASDQIVAQGDPCEGISMLRKTYDRLLAFDSVEELVVNDRTEIVSLMRRDLQRLCDLDERLASPAGYLCDCCTLVTHLNELEMLLNTDTERSVVAAKLIQALECLMQLNQLYTGLEQESLSFLLEARMRLNLFLIVLDANDGCKTDSASILQQTLEEYYEYLELCGKDRQPPKMSFAQLVTNVLEQIQSSDGYMKPHAGPALLNQIQRNPLKFPENLGFERQSIRRKSCVITEPDSDADFTVKFVARLVTSIPVVANLRGFEASELERIRIRIVYPDMKEQLFRPRGSHFRQITRELARLKTDVLLSANLWHDSAPINIDAVIVQKPDDGLLSASVFAKTNSAPKPHTVCSSAPVKVTLLPKSRC